MYKAPIRAFKATDMADGIKGALEVGFTHIQVETNNQLVM